MASDCDTNAAVNKTSTHGQSATAYQPPTRRKLSFRRRKLPAVRLGGKKPRRGFFLVRLFRRARLKSLKLKYMLMVKKLRDYYRSLGKDMIEGSRTMQSFQQRLLLETSFAVPVMGFSFNSIPKTYA